MRATNQKVYSDDRATLVRLQEEFRDYIGRDTELSDGVLTVFAIRRKKPKKRDDKDKGPRNKRAESHGRDR